MLYFKAYLSVKTIDVRGKHAKILIVLQATSNCFSSCGTTATDKKNTKPSTYGPTARFKRYFLIETLAPFAFV